MKIYYAFLLCCLFIMASPSASFGEGTLHTFTTPDGRSLNATIKAHNERTGKIQIKREDGKELWILPTVFSEPDQEYIQQWIVSDQFMSPMKFKITGKKRSEKVTDRPGFSDQNTEVTYEITLENKTDFPLADLKIEYRTFILNQGYEGNENSNRVGGEQLHITEIPVGKKISQKTQPVILITKFRHVTETSSNGNTTQYLKKTMSERLKGVWIKVYGPEVDGVPSIREWCNPSDTRNNFVWQEIKLVPQTERLVLIESRKLWKSDPEKAIEIAQQCYETAQSPAAACVIGLTYLHYLKPNKVPLGIEWLEKAAVGNDYTACCWLAKTYSTYIDPQYHNSKKGIKYGLQAVSMIPRGAEGHEKLAEAYALDGQFKKAVEHAQIAYDTYKLSGPEGLAPIIKARLKFYRNHQPCPPYSLPY